ncbi:MAG: CoB--CoM heterodisulfide reductase iron-sulfur subunit A family protein [Bacteroidota bacterium]|nr:CoB--CoM heterodisulfide reductase iron-sulfur subunit A family protein [Bacteroidota bacterium]
MSPKKITGVYFTGNIDAPEPRINIREIMDFTSNIPGVSIVLNGDLQHQGNPEKIQSAIKQYNLDRLIIAGSGAGFMKPLLATAFRMAGKDHEDIVVADFEEYLDGVPDPTGWVKGIIYCAVLGVPFMDALVPEEVPVQPDTLVIGGGIAGIQASLEIANARQKVYLVEKTGTIGGHMAMFDKTFPTLDCAACILTPKMVEVGQHSNIDLLTYCEVKKVEGEPGNYKVTILKKARRVDLSTCIGCGICSEKCPAKVPSEFDAGTTLRKAIYIPFPQAVPNKYLIDAEHCMYVQENGKCGVCVKVCPASCINLDAVDEELEIQVGNIVVATGFQAFDAGRIEQFGYGKYPNVLTSLEFERLVNAAGPTGGNLRYRTRDKKGNWVFVDEGEEPSSIAIIHCIGSRDRNYNKYCSRVCCMYSLKMAHLVKEKNPKADVYEYYIDMRAFGKGYEEFYERIKEEGVNIIRGKTALVEKNGNKLRLRSEDMLNDRILEQDVDMVILSVGLEARNDAGNFGKMLGISVDEYGWFRETNAIDDSVGTFTGGITIAGTCQGPKDIPDSVAQGSAAAAKVLESILKGSIKRSIKDLPLSQIQSEANKISQS